MSLEFIPAQQKDIPVIKDILDEATTYKAHLGDMAWGTEGWTKEEVADSMSESTMYVISDGTEVVGTVSLQWSDERNWGEQPPVAGYMHRLAIRDGHHGQGLGEQIVDMVASKVRDKGRSLLRLDCEAKNTDLCSYYEKLGFKRVGERPVPEYGDYVAALYERRI